ncbi:MAG: hypothetical protein BJ554DRAFT_7175 [Olpidium bornovanus]|uniref:Uncharacterized protein n=1 Tax=Olpidium bornovanus TaxID=278681 RepID=A0A8H7ZWH6_9FUNG|nr:MAG: hypothetical protein BJ554DRAFT_7175 [Olpidium bornovanus]
MQPCLRRAREGSFRWRVDSWAFSSFANLEQAPPVAFFVAFLRTAAPRMESHSGFRDWRRPTPRFGGAFPAAQNRPIAHCHFRARPGAATSLALGKLSTQRRPIPQAGEQSSF